MLSQPVSHVQITVRLRPRRTEAVMSVCVRTLAVSGGSRRTAGGRFGHLLGRVATSVKELTLTVSQLELLSLSSAQAELGVSRSTIYRLIDDGELDRVHIRSGMRITRHSLDRYLTHQIEFARAAGGKR